MSNKTQGKSTPTVRIFIALTAFLCLSQWLSNPAFAQKKPILTLPVNCALNEECWIVNYVDMDPTTNNARDFTCGGKTYDDHKGTDFALRSMVEMHQGQAVLAAADGEILRLRQGENDNIKSEEELEAVRTAQKECGNGILIDHSAAGFPGLRTMYCHLKNGSITVKTKDTVKAGQKIAEIGRSGMAEFPHLHFGVIWEGAVIDPFTGTNSSDGCGKGGNRLWKKDIPYSSINIYDSGFQSGVPNFKIIENGAEAPKSISASANSLVFWSAIYGAQEGDKVEIEVKDPYQRVFAKRFITQESTRARQYYYTGRKLRKETLPAGIYKAKITIKRAGISDVVHIDTITVN